VRANNKVCTSKTRSFGKASISRRFNIREVCLSFWTHDTCRNLLNTCRFHVGHFTYHYNYGKIEKNCGVSTPFMLNTFVPFIVSLSTATLSHRKPTLVRIPRNSCRALGNYKITSIWEYEYLQSIFTTLQDLFFFQENIPKTPSIITPEVQRL
jgi:hypothetical protein